MEITEEQVDDALHYLTYKAPKLISDTKKNRIVSESLVKSVKSEIFLREQGSVAERDAKSYANPIYQEAVEKMADATREEELIKRQMEAASMRIEIWRSLEASKRNRI